MKLGSIGGLVASVDCPTSTSHLRVTRADAGDELKEPTGAFTFQETRLRFLVSGCYS